jgi:hypothetical protein
MAMYPLAVHDPYLDSAASACHEHYFEWRALEAVIDEWPVWRTPVNPDHNDAAASLAPAPVLLPEYVDLSEVTPPAAANPSCHAASKDEKILRPRELTMVLHSWLERRPAPYASLEEKKMIAEALSIPVTQVTNFCNNFRKRYVKVGTKLTSYRELASAAQ